MTMSLLRALGMHTIITVAEPIEMTPGPAGTQLGCMHGSVMLPTVAASLPLIFTVVAVTILISYGLAGWAIGVGTGAAGWIGAWQCGPACITLSPLRAASAIAVS